ncbi:hypothetical protein TC41_1737 [Alicyclobacillus acidocaldarius subsp. acidocaldarius Tc-4-1]|uniref:TadE family protein n=1 Tax=Alicyclobacillus acidocaldarius (strain Tc-4-1) TaxID=1048834 RepID=F8IL98_ALIAT|nr:hypothetical protein TC41_1737 [Alicyclobacillus acidocaldarius subsp. acidocaldarius Tc-4-1]
MRGRASARPFFVEVENMRWRRGGTGISALFAGLVNTGIGLVIVGLMLTFVTFFHIRNVIGIAAENGARAASITGDPNSAEQAVQSTLQAANLPLTYHGQTLWNTSMVQVTADVASPEVQVTVQYDAPYLFTDLFAALGMPNSFPAVLPMSATATDVNESYFGSEGV